VKKAALVLAFALGPALSFGCEEAAIAPPPELPTVPTHSAPLGPEDAEPPPLGKLPTDVRPHHYTLALDVDPAKDRFSGVVDVAVDLQASRSVVWMHAKGLTAKRATIAMQHGEAPVEARFEEVDPTGVVALRLPSAIGPGLATIHIEYDAPYASTSEGLFVLTAGGARYVFSDLEPSHARTMFPSFDEPLYKTPFDVSVTVPKGMKAVGNAHETGRSASGDGERVTFATTAPLPTYLVELAVGPLDVVEAAPLPATSTRKRALSLRGVATQGKGKELAYALAHTGEIVAALEEYFGTEYPFDKLDLIAIPNLSGAMENAGAITFREGLLLVDEKNAPIDQQRSFANVVAHELAHQWFGDLVTMKWWDDLWLNEAFATWMAARTVMRVRPENRADIGLLEASLGAMGTDALMSARSIRQPITDQNDVANAFDDITYRKGGAVLTMFEHWIGEATFQRGIRAYLGSHKFGSGTTEDLLAALSVASGRDVVTPFKTFLDQPGVPFVEARVECAAKSKEHFIALKQSRYLPLGSKGDTKHTWQIPVCARYASGKDAKVACTLLAESEGKLAIAGDACPAWVIPNADGTGYYRWALDQTSLKKLRADGWGKLTTREKMSVANSLQAAFAKGVTPADAILAELAPLAKDPEPSVASMPMEMIRVARDWLYADPARDAVEAYGRKLYADAYRELGWGAKNSSKKEDPQRGVLRQRILRFLAFVARDPEVRKEAAKRGRAYVGFGGDGALHLDAVDAELAGIALAVAVQDGGADLWEAVDKRLSATEDAIVRSRLIEALASTLTPELAARARALALDPRLRGTEILQPLSTELDQRENRTASWDYLTSNIEAIIGRLPPGRAGGLPWAAAHFCDADHAAAARALFGPRLDKLQGSPRNLASALEAIELCQARRGVHEATFRAFFGGKGTGAKVTKKP
jgi:alanyl aminopeptidase